MSGRDPAAQPERTRLAWRRTVLATAVVGAVAVRYVAVSDPHAMDAVLLATLTLVWLVIGLMTQRRIRQLRAAKPDATPAIEPILLTAAVLLFIGVTALSVVLR